MSYKQDVEVNYKLRNFHKLATMYKVREADQTLLLAATLIGLNFGACDQTYRLLFTNGFSEYLEFIINIVADGLPEENQKVIEHEYSKLLAYEELDNFDHMENLLRVMATYLDRDGEEIKVIVYDNGNVYEV